MSRLRLLIVEDSEQDLSVFRDSVLRYMDENGCNIELIECRGVEDAFNKLDNSFDGAIIDLKLANQGDEGNQVIRQIEKLNFRIPVIILTGTPDATDSDFTYIKTFSKGSPEAQHTTLLNFFWDIYNTGLTRIMGGRGIIEETLAKVFRDNLLPQKDRWVAYSKINHCSAEKALLRHALNHLLQLLDEEGDKNFPEEMYLYPPLSDALHTGSIVKTEDEKWFVVMNPACDLIIRDGRCKTDRILIVEIDSQTLPPFNNLRGRDIERAYRNNKWGYYHWLPRTDFFDGGFLNFRKLSSLSHDEFQEKFGKPIIQISLGFVKDIVARFSAYYARQGQPDIDFTHCIRPRAPQTENSQ